MAFSYSDKNFTVVGNLCFVHIDVKDKNATYFIPPAIGDRMLVNNIIYPYMSHDGDIDTIGIGFAIISNTEITLGAQHNKGYLMCYFPIDSNK